jgi:hypothetical protein
MPATSFDNAQQARAALRAIVAEPEHGAEALSSPQTLANLLQDLLPDAPRETGLLIAAANAGIPATLRGHIAQGLDVQTAINLAVASLESLTAFTPEACDWVTSEMAIALGLGDANDLAGPNEPRHVGTETNPAPILTTSPPTEPAFSPPPAPSVREAVAQASLADNHGRRRYWAFLAVLAVAAAGSYLLGYSIGIRHAIVRTRIETRTVTRIVRKPATGIPCWEWSGGVTVLAPPSTQTSVKRTCDYTEMAPLVYSEFQAVAPDGTTVIFTVGGPH